ncbi:hypothetical protein SAMN04488033_10488 [Salegentibacter agarivorans]|uniref:Uncharacterized protein n=1 Tax=Salegentibacter agarivorans TaxID=345907 RepID=A0A1I2KNE5_9FLAO|nr:hypothetical protein [Salegentibacter agarivorans]SFF68475.1 hypothetical protein SAMN04488033_10488 [Salegentibacter agarivorans]
MATHAGKVYGVQHRGGQLILQIVTSSPMPPKEAFMQFALMLWMGYLFGIFIDSPYN